MTNKSYVKVYRPTKIHMGLIASIIEEWINNGYDTVMTAKKFNTSPIVVGSHLSNYWFPYTGDNGVVMVMESKINKPEEELIEI